VKTASPSIMDIAPTVLNYFRIPIPGDIDGKALF
jgi:bisphosphoglycerate-independent phosphoglycerate mutase (AlkP superfamily)